MSGTIMLLHAKATGHILGAATVAAQPDGNPKPEALAGEFLPVRHNGNPAASVLTQSVPLPASELAILPVDAGVFPIANARSFVVDLENKAPKPLTLTANTPILTPAPTSTTLTVTQGGAGKTFAWAHIAPINPPVGSQAVAQTVTAKPISPSIVLAFPLSITLNPLPPGQYGVLVLIPDSVPLVQIFNI
jgi:hypothetical protein